MKIFSTLGLIIFLCHFTFAQINTELIKKNITDNPQEYFYSPLEIFKTDPTELTQEQLNQLYYGSKFLKPDYSIGDYNIDIKFWKIAKKKLSRSKAEKIINEAESKYLKNPLNKSLLDDMTNIYTALGLKHKANICTIQKNLITKTIENSGDGETEETAICVIAPGEVLQYLEKLTKSGPKAELDQKMKQLPEGSILTTYKIGERQINVKLVGGYFF